jgi:iron complex outermembrane receptor protein
MPRSPLRLLAAALCVLMAHVSPARAQSAPPDLSQVSLEDLMNLEITSASRKEQRVADVAAAVFVITQEDIRRSGKTTIPDLLRLVPGVEVAQINANKWAVSVRGFNGFNANKLLVLVDGRSLYNRLFSGILWDTVDLMLDDVDRIEVIRCPGATMWGANAVNGVVNIVTKATADTRGALVRVDGGISGGQGAARYGGTLGSATYRVFSQWTSRAESLLAPDTGASDTSQLVTTGFRADWTAQPGTFMVDGAYTSGHAFALWPNFNPATAASQPLADVASGETEGHLIGRWTQTRASGAQLQIQSFFDLAERVEPIGTYHRHAESVDAQYHQTFGAHHDLVAGAGSWFTREQFVGNVGFSLTPAMSNSSLFTAFLQDEIALADNRLAVTLGSQVQYDTSYGAGVQPTARVIWKGFRRQRLWASVSRALRTPSLIDGGFRVDQPPVATASGLPLVVSSTGDLAPETEDFVDAEVGYRLDIGTAWSIDVTGFVGRYDNLVTQEVAAPVIQFVPSPHILVVSHGENLLDATTRGLEIAGHWAPRPAWRFDGSYTAFHITPDLAATSLDPAAATTDAAAPRTQWQVRSAYSPGARATLDVAIFHVGPLEQMQVAAYTRADVSAEWRLTSRLSAMAIGQNLFDAVHVEFAGTSALLLATQVRRSVGVRLRWMFAR